MTTIKVANLFPDILNLQGEHASLRALDRVAQANALDLELTKITSSSTLFDPLAYDFIFMGVGELSSLPLIKRVLEDKLPSFREYIDLGRPMLVGGTTVSLWSQSIEREDGTVFEGLGLLPLKGREKTMVYGDDLFFQAEYAGKKLSLIGGQIQLVDYFLQEGAKSFGQVIYGYGNNGQDKTEGLVLNHAIFSNLLGPSLVSNPHLALAILQLAVHGDRDLTYDMAWEKQIFSDKLTYISEKKTGLSNCQPEDVLQETLYGI